MSAAEVGFGLAEDLDATVHALSVGDTSLTHRSSIGGSGPMTEDDVAERASE